MILCAKHDQMQEGFLGLVIEMRKMAYTLGCLVFLPWDGGAHANGVENLLDLLDAPVAYSASYMATDGKGTFVGKVWHEPGRERRDFATKHGDQTALLRRDQDAAFLINASAKWYVAVNFHAALALAGSMDDLVLERKKLGPDMVEGQKTIHYRLSAHSRAGREFVGDYWALASGVPVKLAGLETEPNGRATEVTLVQSDIQAGIVKGVSMDVPNGLLAVNLRKVPAENLVQTMQSLAPLLSGKMK